VYDFSPGKARFVVYGDRSDAMTVDFLLIDPVRHSGGRRNPVISSSSWVPAGAGKTENNRFQRFCNSIITPA
jgi:hypothetical protein